MNVEHGLYKQRVVGGLVLVALGAIVMPFFLDMHQDDQWWGKENIPKKPDNGFVTRVLPLEEWSKQTRSELAQAKQDNKSRVAVPPPAAERIVTAPPLPAPEAAAAPAPPPVAPKVSDTAPEKTGWVVQLASFSNQSNAEDLRARLQAKGYHVFIEPLEQGGRTIYRVRIGPESQRAAAESLRDRVARGFKLKGIVLHTP